MTELTDVIKEVKKHKQGIHFDIADSLTTEAVKALDANTVAQTEKILIQTEKIEKLLLVFKEFNELLGQSVGLLSGIKIIQERVETSTKQTEETIKQLEKEVVIANPQKEVSILNFKELIEKLPKQEPFPKEIQTKILNQVQTLLIEPNLSEFSRNKGAITGIRDSYDLFTINTTINRNEKGEVTSITREVIR